MRFFNTLAVTSLTISQLLFACEKHNAEAQTPKNQNGVIKGRVTDSKNSPMAGVQVVAEHTVFYNSYKTGVTGNDGYYSIEVGSSGSWKPSVVIQKNFENYNYEFDLNPGNPNPISAAAGGICDFNWKLSGQVPGIPNANSFYGASIRLYPELVTDPNDVNDQPFDLNDLEKVEIKIIDGNVIDGSAIPDVFKSFKKVDNTSGLPTLNDIPVGKYKIAAQLRKPDGSVKPLKIAYMDPAGNQGSFGATATVTFREKFSVRSYGARIVVDYL